VLVLSQDFALEDASGSHTCLQPVQQWVTEFIVSARGCEWIPRLPSARSAMGDRVHG
jgi:hypothetical protein